MKILSIGNSFSNNATHYVRDMAQGLEQDITTVNLYIGGCPLSAHYENAKNNLASYSLEYNGNTTGFMVSIKDALCSNEFDIVTLQQVSHLSFDTSSYQPYLSYLVDYVKQYRPDSKLFIHQTWGYLENSQRLGEVGFSTHEQMYNAIEKAYDEMYKMSNADGLIPSGRAIYNLHKNGAESQSIYADSIHANVGFGQYTLALTWIEYLSGKEICDCSFDKTEMPLTKEQRLAARQAAHEACVWAKNKGYLK